MTSSRIYSEDELLPLSGIQHFAFCERQWALIHVECQWEENVRTVEGRQLHERVDDPYFTETRKNIKVVRSVPIVSRVLGLYGVADVIEYQKNPDEASKPEITIIEYKRGKPKPDDRDEVQLCAQAMCLEEMLNLQIDYGYFFYGEIRHRHKIEFNVTLRTRVRQLAKRMHELFEKGETPLPKKQKNCRYCSLVNLCTPTLSEKRRAVGRYLTNLIKEVEEELWENNT